MKVFGIAIPLVVLLILAYFLGTVWSTPVDFVRSKVGV